MSNVPTSNPSIPEESRRLIYAEALVKRFGFFNPITPVNGVSMNINRGEIVALLGSNGAGKSTTFDMLSGLTQPSAGTISLWDDSQKKWVDITRDPLYKRAQKGICYLPQKPSIFANLSAKDNLLGIMEMMKPEQLRRLAGANSREALCMSLLTKFNLQTHANKLAKTLSGGEQRRLEIARAFIQRPKLILMDEPFAAVDLAGIRDCSDLFKDVCKKDGVSILIIDHRIEAVLSIADRGYFMSKGKVVFEGKPYEIVRNAQIQQELLADRVHSMLEMFPMPEEEARRERELQEAERRIAILSEEEKRAGLFQSAGTSNSQSVGGHSTGTQSTAQPTGSQTVPVQHPQVLTSQPRTAAMQGQPSNPTPSQSSMTADQQRQLAQQRETERREKERQDAARWQSEWLKTNASTLQGNSTPNGQGQGNAQPDANGTTEEKKPFTFRTFRKRNTEDRK